MVLLKRLIQDGAPINGVGIQGHWSTATVPYAAIDKAIADYASLGLKVSISELDVTIRGAFRRAVRRPAEAGAARRGCRPPPPATQPRRRGGRFSGRDAGAPATQPFARGGFGGGGRGRGGPVTPASPQDLQAQADAYARIFSIFAKHKDAIERVTFWGLSDRRTWRFGPAPPDLRREQPAQAGLRGDRRCAAAPKALPAGDTAVTREAASRAQQSFP